MSHSVIKLRFCPSPTGLMHLGNTRTALFSALYALKTQGIFLLRIEDTDQSRSKVEYAVRLQEDLQWLGLDWQEGPGPEGPNGPYWQSQRQSIYDSFYDDLITEGRAYPCFCSDQQLALTRKVQRASGRPPRYPGTCRGLTPEEIQTKMEQGLSPTLRFKIPKQEMIEFNDLVKGHQRFLSDDIGDFIIRRQDKTAPFMYCNAIDDALMGVTHVLRGEDHLTNTPRQLMLLDALKLPRPQYGHISLIVALDGSPLSKRHGSRSVKELREEGYLPIAINNYLARLGHYYEDNNLMLLTDLAMAFDFSQLGRAPAKFDPAQLNYWQKEAIAQSTVSTLWEWMGKTVHEKVPPEKRALFIETVTPNLMFPEDALKWAKILFSDGLEFYPENRQVLQDAGDAFFRIAATIVTDSGTDFKTLCEGLTQQTGKKGRHLFQPLRVALTNELHGPEMGKVMAILGQDVIIKRLNDIHQIFVEK